MALLPGWGPNGQAFPLKLEHCVPSQGNNEFEAFELRNEVLPLSPWSELASTGETVCRHPVTDCVFSAVPKPIDTIPGWTLYRRIAPVGTPAWPISDATDGAYWSPHLHFQLISLPTLDLQLYNHFSATHELAHFTAFWLVTRLIPGTGGARRSMMFGERPDQEGPRRAKLMTTGGREGKGGKEQRDIGWVGMETGPMKEALTREFGFKF